MVKKYVFNGLMILFIILAFVGFALPFYSAYITSNYGDVTMNGSISISGFAFMFGLTIFGNGDFSSISLETIAQPFTLTIFIFAILIAIGAITSICLKNKTSLFYLILNTSISILSIVFGIFSFINLSVINVSLTALDNDNLPFLRGVTSENIAFGAMISGISFILVAIFAFLLAFIAFYEYRLSLKDDMRIVNDPDLLVDPNSYKKVTYEDKKEIEHHKIKNLSFTKNKELDFSKDDENKENIDETKNNGNTFTENKKSSSIYDVNEDIVTRKVDQNSQTKKDSFEKSLAQLNDLYMNKSITKEDYEKYKDELYKKYFKG